MIIGHYAVALAAKKAAPRTSLGTLIAAAAFLDVLWPFLLLLGIEQVEIAPGITPFTPLDFTHYPWSHSLVMAVVWGLVFGAVYFVRTNYRPGAIACAVLVPSHWVLDWIVHRPDLPLTPFTSGVYGLGLWNSITLTLAVELVMLAVGVWIYVVATKSRDRIGTLGLVGFLALTLILYGAAVFGPPPPSVTAIAVTDMGQFLFIALAAWVDRHRVALA
jgi:hypothetical protein